MEIFAKTFKINDNQQVLLTKNYNDEDECYELEQRTDYLGMVMKIKLRFDDVEAHNQAFRNYNKQDASNFIQQIKNLVS